MLVQFFFKISRDFADLGETMT